MPTEDEALGSLDDKANVFDKEQESEALASLGEAILPGTTCCTWIAFAKGALTPDLECYVPEVSTSDLDEQIASADRKRKDAKDTVTLKAPTVHDKTAPVKKIPESKVSLKVLMTSLSVQYPIRTPLPHSMPCVYPVRKSLRASVPCLIHCLP